MVTGGLGYLLLAGIVFAETGLLVGLFLPGDSSAFTVGVVAGAGGLDIVQICALALRWLPFWATRVATSSGYRTGPSIFSRQRFPALQTGIRDRVRRSFYEKHGGKTLIYAKFVPIVRTFAPFMAGVGRMRYARFLSFNVVGGLGWVLSMTLAGYVLGGIPLHPAAF